MTAIDLENDRLLKISEVCHRTGLSESTVYRRIKTDDFPSPISLGPGTVRWLLSEIESWIAAKIKGR